MIQYARLLIDLPLSTIAALHARNNKSVLSVSTVFALVCCHHTDIRVVSARSSKLSIGWSCLGFISAPNRHQMSSLVFSFGSVLVKRFQFFIGRSWNQSNSFTGRIAFCV
jgi:hypothetical protein